MGEWISVEDELPELNQEVLCIDEFDTYEATKYAHGYIGGGPYFFCSNGIFEATHWQPLPEPPQ